MVEDRGWKLSAKKAGKMRYLVKDSCRIEMRESRQKYYVVKACEESLRNDGWKKK